MNSDKKILFVERLRQGLDGRDWRAVFLLYGIGIGFMVPLGMVGIHRFGWERTMRLLPLLIGILTLTEFVYAYAYHESTSTPSLHYVPRNSNGRQGQTPLLTGILNWIRRGFEFVGHPGCWMATFGLTAIVFFLTYECFIMQSIWVARVAIALDVSLVLAFMFHTFYYIWTLLRSASNQSLAILMHIDRIQGEAINASINKIKEMPDPIEQRKEADYACKDWQSDFQSRLVLPRVARLLLLRTLVNYFLTVVCFATLTMNFEIIEEKICNKKNASYGHYCTREGNGTNNASNPPRSFFSFASHVFYYHSVIFQSLGDGDHVPHTEPAQLIAISESFVALFYLVFIFGALLSASMFVHTEITPEKLTLALENRFKSFCPNAYSQGTGSSSDA